MKKALCPSCRNEDRKKRYLEHLVHVMRLEELHGPNDGAALRVRGWVPVRDPESGEVLLYNPTHWKLCRKGDDWDYLFDNVPFRARTWSAREVAESEGYGEPVPWPDDWERGGEVVDGPLPA